MGLKKPEWPMYLENPIRAVHFAIEKPECPHAKPENCPVEKQVVRTLELFSHWQAAQEDIALGRLVDRAAAFIDDPVSFQEIYREACDAGAPTEILAVMERMQETAGGKL